MPTAGAKGGKKATLYNLADDLGETNDLAAQQPDRVAAMMAQFEQIRGTPLVGRVRGKRGTAVDQKAEIESQ